tara:strand:- start:16 stop:465 length:450 start_codon:yes stop_codon:yes gene_type:complete
MKLKEFKERLQIHINNGDELLFRLEDGTLIPPYFHITEMGMKIKHFVDCGGVPRTEQCVNFQIWTADDFDHRLTSEKLLELIVKNEGLFGKIELEVEMEYQTNTIGSYTLEESDYPNALFTLKSKKTNCLAPDKCGVEDKTKECGPSCC